ncbi:ATP-binding protein [Pyrobaculum aerophilum]|uniref:AAA family ATPase n=1 Tax=Pyrobaculum aerophilum TaxID=13773 RepID=A0A371QV75_9CREN|nr:ATP-binding protein [Pyrobaculum aerophilum]RFA93937.1 AAA family ATPase [Pyrobaculum aerophilum]RFA98956.1 AAA family ATPase [Pyrobaculum aerophilum]
MEKVFMELVAEWREGEIPAMVERERQITPIRGVAIAVVGPRRAGKTYLLFQTALRLGRENTLYINFEDVRLVGLKPEHFSDFLKALAEAGNPSVLLLDEIQNVPHWGRWVRSLLDKGYMVVVAGSSSKLSLREVPTELRGRYLSFLLLPFSFREFLKARNIAADITASPASRGRILAALREYVEMGGYPEVVMRPDLAQLLLKSYRDTVAYRDVVERHKIRDAASFEVFMSLIEASFGNVFSISAAHRRMRGMGLEKSKKTLANYLKYLEEAFYIITVPKWGPGKTSLLQPRKIYPIDPGYLPKGQWGRKMETAVAVELARRGISPKYYRGKGEVDFITEDEAIQVTYASSPDEIDRRELTSLEEAVKATGKRPLIITWDYEGEIVTRGIRVRAVPLWKWLLFGS